MATVVFVLAAVAGAVALWGVSILVVGLIGGQSVSAGGERGQPLTVSSRRRFRVPALVRRGLRLLGLAAALGVAALIVWLMTK